MGLLTSLFFGFIPMFFFAYIIYWMDRYEKEPKLLLGVVFIWGALVAAGAAFLINTLFGMGVYIFTQSDMATEMATGSLIAPIVEESLKGFAVLLVFVFFRREFDSILDGIVYAAIAALGFAATENTYYIYNYGFLENSWSGLWSLVFIRVILVGWQHPFYTAFTGIGLAVARLNRSMVVKVLAFIVGWFVAVSAHALHNTLASLLSGAGGRVVGTALDWGGWFLMALFIIFMINRERKTVIQQLREEVQLGTMTEKQYSTACSALAQTGARLAGLFSGSFGATSRFYQLCGELSHKKNQMQRLGDESGNEAIIVKLRGELKALSGRAAA